MSKAYRNGSVPGPWYEAPGRFAMEDRQAWRATGKIAAAVLSVLLGITMLLVPSRAVAASGAAAQVSVGVSVSFGPPPIPVYAQPMCPGPGYMWTPGYWAWDPSYGYYWVPGTWVLAPFPGALWTPGYWGWEPARAIFIWHAGYWGPRVGFYGGINYGFGYFGVGYVGGYWDHDRFFYNRAVNRINVVNITNVYNRTVIVHNETRVSYNGGRGGIMARPTREDYMAERDRRMGAIRSQMDHERMAERTPAMRWSQNHGRPDIAATPRPGMFRGRGVSRALRSGGAYNPGPQRPGFRNFGQPGGRQQRQQPQYQRRGAPQPQYRYRGMPQRGNQPGPSNNQRQIQRGQPRYRGAPQRQMQRGPSQPQYRGPQGGQQQRGPRGPGNENRQGNPRGQGQDRGRGGHRR
jgi:hypothetical protein